jgi:hypothetical protein
VPPFRSALVVSGGTNEGDACETMAYHGFKCLDREIVGLAASFP